METLLSSHYYNVKGPDDYASGGTIFREVKSCFIRILTEFNLLKLFRSE